MPTEIERKFLISDQSWRAQIDRSCAMQQGYLVSTGNAASVRVRIEGERANLNIKAAVVGASRAEYEYPIPLDEAREMLDSLCVGLVSKTRHYLDQGELTWEIDEFHGENRGLLIAEIELPQLDHAFELPSWIGREVTSEQRYYNHSLAIQPYRSWDASGN